MLSRLMHHSRPLTNSHYSKQFHKMRHRLHPTLVSASSPAHFYCATHREIVYGEECAVVVFHLAETPVPVCPECTAPVLVKEKALLPAKCLNFVVIHILHIKSVYSIILSQRKENSINGARKLSPPARKPLVIHFFNAHAAAQYRQWCFCTHINHLFTKNYIFHPFLHCFIKLLHTFEAIDYRYMI